jgi:NADH-quinone oxidoreductase subunit J
MIEQILEIMTAVAIIVSAIAMITRKNALYAALWLINCFLFTAVLYVIQDSVFMGFLQVLTYAGAILVLVIFSIMLMDLRDDQSVGSRSASVQIVTGASALLSILLLTKFFVNNYSGKGFEDLTIANWGGLQHMGMHLYERGGLFPFEFITVLLLGTLVGCVQLAKRKEWL